MTSEEGVPFTLPAGCHFFSDLCYTVDKTQIGLPKGCASWSIAWYAFIMLMLVLVPAVDGCTSVAFHNGVLLGLNEVSRNIYTSQKSFIFHNPFLL